MQLTCLRGTPRDFPEARRRKAGIDFQGGRQRGILVVDEAPKFLRFSTALLLGAGLRRARRVRSQVKGMAAKLPDLVIQDISMPGKDGFAVARELRASETPNHVPCGLVKRSPASRSA